MTYIKQGRTLRGTYTGLNFPLPSNSGAVPAAAAIVKAAANGATAGNVSRKTLSGVRRYMGMGDAASTASGAMAWIEQNPITTAGIAVALFLLMGGIGRRR